MTTSTESYMIAASYPSRAAGAEVEYRLLQPPRADDVDDLPLIIHLHGAMSSCQSLELAKPAYDTAWALGHLPPCLVACASTPTLDGFYIDFHDGPKWETVIATEFPELVATHYAIGAARAAVGFSMGGYGALKLAFRAPENYAAIAALCPAIFPAETPDAVLERNRPAVLGELHKAMGLAENDYRNNSVYGIARSNRARICAAAPAIYLDCGELDEFGLFDGSQYLHQVMDELGIVHQFHPVASAGHAGEAAAVRQADAIRFIGDVLKQNRHVQSAGR